MTNENDITQLFHTYERSLNDSDAALAASCYATDGVFMPTTQPTATAGVHVQVGYWLSWHPAHLGPALVWQHWPAAARRRLFGRR